MDVRITRALKHSLVAEMLDADRAVDYDEVVARDPRPPGRAVTEGKMVSSERRSLLVLP